MARPIQALKVEALKLSEGERLQLASELIDSVEGPADPGWEAAWADEIDHRVSDAVRTGNRGRSWEDIKAERWPSTAPGC